MRGGSSIIAICLVGITGCQQVSPSSESSVPLASPPPSAQGPSPLSSPSPGSSTSVPAGEQGDPPAASEPEICEITQARVADPNPPLNVRSSPDTQADNVVGTLENGQFVTVIQQQAEWLEITIPIQGWIAKSRTQTSCNQKRQRLSVSAGDPTVVVGDRFIGSGSHWYFLPVTAGQTLSITAQGDSPLPAIFAPTDLNQQVDLVGVENRDRKRWSGEVGATGDYLLRFDSNVRGYEYKILLKLD